MSRKEIRERAWKHMELLLDKEIPNKRRRRIGFYLPYAAAILLFGTLSTYIFINHQTPDFIVNQSDPIQIKPLESPILPSLLQVDKEKAIKKMALQNNELNQEVAYVNTAKTIEPLESKTLTAPVIAIKTPKESPKLEIKSKPLNITIDKQTSPSENSQLEPTLAAQPQNNKKTNFDGFETEDLITNQKKQQVLLLTPDIKSSFQLGKDMGLKTNGAIGLVSENLEDYGLRLGLGFTKPIGQKFSANTGIRYSIYEDNYASTYQTDTPEDLLTQFHISAMKERSVSRSFVEVPVYGTYHLSENLSIKSGVLATYNRNNSESPSFSTQTVVNNTLLSEEEKREIGKLYNDENGYLGEYLIGASLQLDRVSFDIEATRGFLNNQDIDNRNVIGMRIGYKFGR